MTHFDILAVFWLSWMCSQRVLRSKKMCLHTQREKTLKKIKSSELFFVCYHFYGSWRCFLEKQNMVEKDSLLRHMQFLK